MLSGIPVPRSQACPSGYEFIQEGRQGNIYALFFFTKTVRYESALCRGLGRADIDISYWAIGDVTADAPRSFH